MNQGVEQGLHIIRADKRQIPHARHSIPKQVNATAMNEYVRDVFFLGPVK